ncbi:MAG: YHS domain-containing (seleno)protein [Cyanobacteria bacterium P01_F01_bin.33]
MHLFSPGQLVRPISIVLGLSLMMSCSPSTPHVSGKESRAQAGTVEANVSPENSGAVSGAREVPIASADTKIPAAVFVDNGIAIRGADVVAYFSESSYVPGRAEFAYEWGGATWQFANAQNRDEFVKNPGQYAPQYGGFCAWAVSQGYTAPVDPTAWEIVNGKLYLNFNASVQRRWQQDIPGNIAKGDRNWPGVLNN